MSDMILLIADIRHPVSKLYTPFGIRLYAFFFGTEGSSLLSGSLPICCRWAENETDSSSEQGTPAVVISLAWILLLYIINF